jgi:hypothetical protein
MRFRHLIIAAALTLGMGGAASAAPLTSQAPVALDASVPVEWAQWGGDHRWKMYASPNYGSRGHHRGWSKHNRGAYYAPPRRQSYAPPRRHYGGYYQPRRSYYRPSRPQGYYAYPRRPRGGVQIRLF